jgi:hypothetical protein
MVTQAASDAQHLDVPLYVCQAADVADWRCCASDSDRDAALHQVLTVPNIYKTGGLHGLLCLHVGMRVRLLSQISAADSLVKEQAGVLVRIDSWDPPTSPGFQVCYSPKLVGGVWVLMDLPFDNPIEDDLLSLTNDASTSRRLLCIRHVQATFTTKVRMANAECNLDVTRWQLPLTHEMAPHPVLVVGL